MEEIRKELEQLKTDVSTLTNKVDELSLPEQVNRYVDVKNISSLIEVVSSAPTHTPSDLYGQVKIYQNAGTYRLYVYDVVNNAWRYVALS